MAVNHLGLCPGGGPEEASRAALVELAQHPGVHVLLSGEYAYSSEGHPHLDLAPRTRALYDAFGAERLMRASDFPWIDRVPGYGETLGLVA